MLPELPRQRSNRRSEDATTIQRHWRGWRWRLWRHGVTTPFVSSWHPRSMFLDVELFESILDEPRRPEAEAIRTELEDAIKRCRALAKMAADHYGRERVADALERIREQTYDYDHMYWETEQLVEIFLELHGVPLT